MDELCGFFGTDSEAHLTRSKSKALSTSYQCLPPEVEEGNVEYKLKLVNPSPVRVLHLTTQMKWRLTEGQGEAVYQIGVVDNGTMLGLSKDDMASSLAVLKQMVNNLSATMAITNEVVVAGTNGCARKVVQVTIKKPPSERTHVDVRVAVLGATDAGKSTLIGVVTSAELDDGHGRARLNIFRHLHEIQSGRTSCISYETLGFDHNGDILDYSESRTIEDICENAAKLISFIDLAGHQKYIHTTVRGLTGHSPHYAMVVVGANQGLVHIAREHVDIALALEIPILFVISKIDICPPHIVNRTIRQIDTLVTSDGLGKTLFRVYDEEDSKTAQLLLASSKIVPLFFVSSMTGEAINLFKGFLKSLKPGIGNEELQDLATEDTEFLVDEIFFREDIGAIVGGTVKKGTITVGDRLHAGPTDDGSFFDVNVTSIHRSRAACLVVRANQTATLSIGAMARDLLRKGMALVTHTQPTVCRLFQADMRILYRDNSVFAEGSRVMAHIESVRQTAIVLSVESYKNEETPSVHHCVESVPIADGSYRIDNSVVFGDNIRGDVQTVDYNAYATELGTGNLVKQGSCVENGVGHLIHASSALPPRTSFDDGGGHNLRFLTSSSSNPVCLETGSSAIISFKFINQPEYINVGCKIFIMAKSVKAVGLITKVTRF